MRIYVSGALTGVVDEEVKPFYEKIGEACKSIDLEAYVPHLATDPKEHPNVSARDVFVTDKSELLKSDLVVAYVGIPSLGSGAELAYAEEYKIPVILLYKQGQQVSRMIRGMPNVFCELKFESFGGVIGLLKATLLGIKQEQEFQAEKKK